MKKELELSLRQEYPVLYKNFEDRFYCGSGWYELLRELSHDLSNVISNTPGLKVSIDQIKEKFGGLRFYVDIDPETSDDTIRKTIWELVSKYEDKSYEVCEETGKPGEQRTDLPWIKTLCDEEYQKRLKK